MWHFAHANIVYVRRTYSIHLFTGGELVPSLGIRGFARRAYRVTYVKKPRIGVNSLNDLFMSVSGTRLCEAPKEVRPRIDT